jgi:hypothetical protein
MCECFKKYDQAELRIKACHTSIDTYLSEIHSRIQQLVSREVGVKYISLTKPHWNSKKHISYAIGYLLLYNGYDLSLNSYKICAILNNSNETAIGLQMDWTDRQQIEKVILSRYICSYTFQDIILYFNQMFPQFSLLTAAKHINWENVRSGFVMHLKQMCEMLLCIQYRLRINATTLPKIVIDIIIDMFLNTIYVDIAHRMIKT